jgi:triacylglycerol lipase
MTTQNASQDIGGLTQNQLAIAMLQLCEVSYFAFDQISSAVGTLPKLNPGGKWSCKWGPARDEDDANLAFIATYSPGGTQAPTFAAVVIRGTDLSLYAPINAVIQLWEDLEAWDPQPLPLPGVPSSVLVAGGTLDGLTAIQNLTWGKDITLQAALTALFAGPGQPGFLAVTGHSLGACLATVVAPWLQTALTSYSGQIVPVTFAGPTAGNPDFANYFDGMFTSLSLLYRNPLDIAPLAFVDLSAMEDIYNELQVPLGTPLQMPLEMDALILCAEGLLIDTNYAQPTGNAPALGAIWLITNSWFDEAFYQHHPRTYMNLLHGTNVGALLPSERAAGKSASVRRRLGPLRARVQQLRESKQS